METYEMLLEDSSIFSQLKATMLQGLILKFKKK